ncbi:MAG: radical SAM protein [Planctomycetes bacterium]|nr:radical SAM protein [Planctomycetota bacterium]
MLPRPTPKSPLRQRLRSFVARHTLLERALARYRTLRIRREHPLGIVPDVPKRVIVEPTNACNLKCAYCGNKDMLRPRTNLDLGLYERLLDQMVELGIPRITLHTVGEPTLHPRIADMVRMATERERIVTISTNGTRLCDEDLARALVAAGPHLLNISADAADDETLGKTRDGLKAAVIVEGLRTLRRLRAEVGPVGHSPWGAVKLPTITMTCVVTPLFTPAVEKQFFETYAPLVDDFLFHVANNHADYVADRRFEPNGVLPLTLRDRVYKALRHTCHYPWDALFLLSDGTMSVCRFDFDARIRIGRFGESTIQELWRSDAMNSLRRAHMNMDFQDWPQCESCTATWYENRHEHYVFTRRLMAQHGVSVARPGWLSEDPLGTSAARQRERGG